MQKKRASNLILRIFLILVIMFCSYQLISGISEYWKEYKAAQTLNQEIGRNEKTINWGKLKKKNKDVVGWIYCPGTKIDYPIVKGADNKKYLTTNISGKWSPSGTIFADYNQNKPFREANTIIYGHHMKDGTMFCDLDKYHSQKFLNKHETGYLYTPSQNYEIQFITCSTVSSKDSDIYTVPLLNEDEQYRLVTKALKTAKSKTGWDPNNVYYADCNLITLSTCAYTYNGARTVLIGELMPIYENISEIESEKKEKKNDIELFMEMLKSLVQENIKELFEEE